MTNEAIGAVASGQNEGDASPVLQSTLVTLDFIASQCEFPLLVKLHLSAPNCIDEDAPAKQIYLLGFRTFERLVLSSRVRSADRSKPAHLTLSATSRIAVKVAPLDTGKLYHTTRELVRDFPRYVRVQQDIQYRPEMTIKREEVLELIRIEKRCVKVRGLIEVLICRHFYREVQFPIDSATQLCCSPLVDDTVYLLGDLVRRFPLPRNVVLQNPQLLKVTPAARNVLGDQQVPTEFVLHEVTTQTFIVGLSGLLNDPRSCNVLYMHTDATESRLLNIDADDADIDSRPRLDDAAGPRFEVLASDSDCFEVSVNVDEVADYPFLDAVRPGAVQMCTLDEVLDTRTQRRPLNGQPTARNSNSFAHYSVRKSVALDFDDVGGQLATVDMLQPASAYSARSRQTRRPNSAFPMPAGDRCSSPSTIHEHDSTLQNYSWHSEVNGNCCHRSCNGCYPADRNSVTHVSKANKSNSSFGYILKKRVARLFASKQNVNATVSGASDQESLSSVRQKSKTIGSAPNLQHLGFIKGSQNRRTVVEIPPPGAPISGIISTPMRSKRSPKVVRRRQPGQRGEMRNSSVSLHAHNAKRRAESISSLPLNRLNLVDFDFDITDEMLAAHFNNGCAVSASTNSSEDKAANRSLVMASSAHLHSVASTPCATPVTTPVWYPTSCIPQQLSAYHLQVQAAAAGQKTRSAAEQFEFPPTPKQSTSNGTNSLSSGNDESTRTKQQSSVSLASSGSVQIEDLSVQQLGEYLRRHNLERISSLCEQHAVDGPFFLDLTEADLNGYPFCASSFETKCIKRLQKGIVPKCD